MEHENSGGGRGSGSEYVVAISIVASALILSGVIWVAASGINSSVIDLKNALKVLPSGSSGGGAQPTPGNTFQPSGPADLSFANELPFLGPQDAKVTVVELSDFQCPFCGIYAGREYGGSQFDAARNVTGRLKQDYIDAGKSVKFVFVPIGILGAESVRAAEAALCAGDQGKFWEFHDYLFKKQSGENEGAFADAKLKQFAADLKLDTAKFNGCFDQGKFASKVSELNDGYARVVSAYPSERIGTPTTFVNGQLIVGAQPYSRIKTAIDEELAG